MPAETPPGWSLTQFVDALPDSRRLRTHEPIMLRVNRRNVYVSRSRDQHGIAAGTWHPGKPEEDGYWLTVSVLRVGSRRELPVLPVRNLNHGCFISGFIEPGHVLRGDLYATATALLSAPVLVQHSGHVKRNTRIPLIDILELMHQHG